VLPWQRIRLNPNPGTAQPFLIRIPFEVWNVDDPANPYQVNLTFRDRERNGTERPFYAWNPLQRMYPIIVNSPYERNTSYSSRWWAGSI
jgi:hypothetical protein